MDIPCKGKKFSWFNDDGKSMTRIDRFLMSSIVVARWEVMGQLIDDRNILDHCPIWIIKDRKNWGQNHLDSIMSGLASTLLFLL